MPIDQKRNIVFIHIPKTAGSSVTSVLDLRKAENFFGRAPIEGLLPDNKVPQHFTYSELRGNLPSDFFERAYKFAFIRNPWDRVISEYVWRKGPFFAGQDRHYDRYLTSLEAFIELLEMPREQRLDLHIGFDGHLDPQLSFLVEEGGRIAMDFVGRFESFHRDFAVIASHCGITPSSLPHAMKGDRNADYRPYYSSYCRSAVESIYRDDIRAFGYRF